jgi:trehalose-6-phosphatase
MLAELARDKDNLIYVMSGKKKEQLKDYLQIPNIGLWYFCIYGVYQKCREWDIRQVYGSERMDHDVEGH